MLSRTLLKLRPLGARYFAAGSNYDLVIKNGKIVTSSSTYNADIGISDGKIITIGTNVEGDNVVDAQGHLVIPGGVDAHVHMEYPQGPVPHVSSDDFFTGSRAAALGGTTTIVDFVEARGEETYIEAFEKRNKAANEKAVIDYSFHMSMNRADENSLEEVKDVIEAGLSSFKIYLAYDGIRLTDYQTIKALGAFKKHKGLAIVHAENNDAIVEKVEELLADGKNTPNYYPETRPAVMEGEATNRALSMAEHAGVPMLIVHVSCRESMEAIKRFREKGMQAFGEVCCQHLYLTEEVYNQPGWEGAKGIMSPPLRTPDHHNALWHALDEGHLQLLSTDHCNFFYEGQRTYDMSAFNKCPGGGAGVEVRLPLTYSEGVRTGKISLNRWVDLIATEPARIYGMDNKGSIEVGKDADIVIFDPKKEVTLGMDTLHMNTDFSLYEGVKVTGYPTDVFSKGKRVVENGEFVGERGAGEFIKRGISCAFDVEE
eukprot:TRINITY_DN782029_c0_g1_i1.p1 TRINITY_DN782029_c0_g1~~TRINITY_DN782029_c0_g1_i1.p1  ORF type:complete len:485 (+),score=141.85 TRINITY_DN782029_c0_g1_i1:28-1482(+)